MLSGTLFPYSIGLSQQSCGKISGLLAAWVVGPTLPTPSTVHVLHVRGLKQTVLNVKLTF